MLDWLSDPAHVTLVATLIVTIASAVVKATPSRTDDEWLAVIRQVLEVVAMNAHPTGTGPCPGSGVDPGPGPCPVPGPGPGPGPGAGAGR